MESKKLKEKTWLQYHVQAWRNPTLQWGQAAGPVAASCKLPFWCCCNHWARRGHQSSPAFFFSRRCLAYQFIIFSISSFYSSARKVKSLKVRSQWRFDIQISPPNTAPNHALTFSSSILDVVETARSAKNDSDGKGGEPNKPNDPGTQLVQHLNTQTIHINLQRIWNQELQ